MHNNEEVKKYGEYILEEAINHYNNKINKKNNFLTKSTIYGIICM